jgi:hypothetical protein
MVVLRNGLRYATFTHKYETELTFTSVKETQAWSSDVLSSLLGFSGFGAGITYTTIFRSFRSEASLQTLTEVFIIVHRVVRWA